MSEPTRRWQVAIIGAGPGGLGLAIRLAQSGRRDFVVLEASDGVGGTWRVNTYPGAACDVPSHLYSYSFALKPDWSKTYANQPEILEYFEQCADRFGIRPHLRTRTRITSARWDEVVRLWRLVDDQGNTYEADVLVSAIGTFTSPSYPDIAGLSDFAGPCFHSARWEHEHDLSGRRIAVIGTGASAAQIIPEVAKTAEQVDVYQRTPQWILPRSDKPFTDEEKRRFARDRRAAKKHREEIFWAFEHTIAFRHGDAEALEAIARSHIDYRIKDEDLKARLTPDYPFGCKRTLVCSDFYKALLLDNVELVTERIDRVTAEGILATDGRTRPADVIVLATGFRATEYLEGIDIVGTGGRRLHDDWDEAKVAHAYLGLTVSGYPNFFMMYGPNTNQGGNSIIIILEAQAAYILSALRQMRWRRVRSVDVRRDVMAQYNGEIADALEDTIWHDGCQSYFKNENGKIATQLPQTSQWYAERTRRFRMKEYVRT
jgi:cation diffusion facilitator CzcD-associated flavoprotein CzcO